MVSQDDMSVLNLKHLRAFVPQEGICHVQLDRKPVNAFNFEVWHELLQTLDYVETKLYPKSVRVLIFSSYASDALFSAGHDLRELHVPSTSKARFTKFWLTSTTFLSRLYKSPLYTMAAVHGDTYAAACIMSLCCDYRIALGNTRLGLNEVALGIPVPAFWARLFVDITAKRARGEEALARGELITAVEAHALGLINKIVGEREKLLQQAFAIGEKWANHKGVIGRAETKLSIRKEFANCWGDYALDESRLAWEQLSHPNVIATIGGVLERRNRRKKAKM